jgi:hypothetical protein
MPRREESSWVCARCVRCGVCGEGLEASGDALTDRSAGIRAVDPDPKKTIPDSDPDSSGSEVDKLIKFDNFSTEYLI